MKKYALKIIRDNIVVVPNWEVTPVKFATLAFEMVIHKYLPGSFDRWKVVSQHGCSVKYKDMLTGETAYCWLMKNGRMVTDFDAEDKPQGSPLTVFASGKAMPCDDARMAARMTVHAIFESLRRPAIRRAS